MQKKMYKKIKRALTLIEMIVVLMILTTITGTLAYNYKKSINKSREFEKKEIQSRLKTILEMAIADGTYTPTGGTLSDYQAIVDNSPLANNNFTRKVEQYVDSVNYNNDEVTVNLRN
jgi:prepilin-type N-terminal cleavage/methylation domain-containing protein